MNENQKDQSKDRIIHGLEAFAAHPKVPKIAGKIALGTAHVRGAVLATGETAREATTRMNTKAQSALDEASQKLDQQLDALEASFSEKRSDAPSDPIGSVPQEEVDPTTGTPALK